MTKFEKFSSRLTTSKWGFLLLVAFPILNALVYWLYVEKLDIEWLHYSRLIKVYSEEMTKQILEKILEHGMLYHWAKLSFWIVVLCQLKILIVGIFSIAIAQFFDTNIRASKLFLISLWSHITLCFGMIFSLIHLFSVASPVQIYLKDLDPSSWNSILNIEGDGALQFFTSFEGPIVFISIFILAYLYKHQSNLNEQGSTSKTGWPKSILFATLPYLIYLSVEFYILGIVFSPQRP